MALGVGDRQTKTSSMELALSQNAHPSICPSVCAGVAGELKWPGVGWGGGGLVCWCLCERWPECQSLDEIESMAAFVRVSVCVCMCVCVCVCPGCASIRLVASLPPMEGCQSSGEGSQSASLLISWSSRLGAGLPPAGLRPG